VICYLDAFSGLAGDMLVGAFADAGADRDAISCALTGLATGGVIEWDRVQRRGMSATKFRVSVTEAQKHRHLSGILKMIHAADLPDTVKANAERVFRVLAEAEAAVHGVPIEKVHFHEVGAVDSICDIVGACLALHLLGIDKVYCSPVNMGSGTVNTEHGILPVPAPATARLLQGRPIYSRGPAMELTTPTGAAFVAALTESFGAMPAMSVKSIGYGAGDRDFSEQANVVRVMVGEPSGALESTTVSVIEANIDDASPQVIAYAVDRLLETGALDAIVIPAQMKKGRPGVLLQIVAAPEKREDLVAVLFRETTTLGVRFYSAERRVQPREWIEVRTAHGVVRMKAAPTGFAPEYEDARRIAAETGIPLKEILAEANHIYLSAEYSRNR
jgi:uncharacterized protein (TIGR00299 family) protein